MLPPCWAWSQCIRSRQWYSLRWVHGVLWFKPRQLRGHMDTLGGVLSIQLPLPSFLTAPWGFPLQTSAPLQSCFPLPPLRASTTETYSVPAVVPGPGALMSKVAYLPS